MRCVTKQPFLDRMVAYFFLMKLGIALTDGVASTILSKERKWKFTVPRKEV